MVIKIYEKVKEFFLKNYKTLIAIIIILFVCLFEFPYVVYTPGGIVPLEKRILVEDGYDSDGSFNMSYVSLRKGTMPMILLSFVLPNWDLKEKEEVTIDDESVDDLIKLEKLYMTSSINNATILAYNKASKKLNITKEVNSIVYIDSKASTDLEKYDEIISADGKTIGSVAELKSIINEKKENDYIKILVKRNGKEKECTAKIYKTSDDLKIGVMFLTTYEYDTNPKIEVKTKSSESGSSGGLMLSLAIYNTLVKEDITNGLKVVGTGTIDIDGNVGEIDGVKYKILGAVKSKADLFLCPVENYDEAIKIKDKLNLDIKIEKVSTFDEALEILDSY